MVAALTGDRVTVAMDSQVQHKVLYVYTMLGGLLYMKYTIHLKSQEFKMPFCLRWLRFIAFRDHRENVLNVLFLTLSFWIWQTVMASLSNKAITTQDRIHPGKMLISHCSGTFLIVRAVICIHHDSHLQFMPLKARVCNVFFC